MFRRSARRTPSRLRARPSSRSGPASLTSRRPHLAWFDNHEGVGFEPEIWLDVSATFEIEQRMLAAHASQVALMSAMYDEDFSESMERLCRFRGGQRSTRYAEAFRGCATYPEPDGALRFLVRTLEAR